jgi:hypothetical protein
MIAARRDKTAQTFDLRVQGLVATVRGTLVDLAWKAPDFDGATRQLVGFELFRDDISTHPPSRLTSALVPGQVLEARDLEVLPQSQYGVQPIWRKAGAGPILAIEFGPPRLIKDLAGPEIFVPPEERIHSLAYLQRQGAITSEEMELAVERLLGGAQPAPARQPTPRAVVAAGGVAGDGPSRRTRVALAYVAVAAVLVLALVAAEQLISRFVFNQPSAANHATATPSSQPSPSSVNSASPSPSAVVVDLHPVLIKATDLRAGYVLIQTNSSLLCPKCVPQVSSLNVQLQNKSFKRTIVSAASIAPSTSDGRSVVAALKTFRNASGGWSAVAGLGDEGYGKTIVYSNLGQTYYVVVWRTGVMTNEILLIVPKGTLSLQSAIDLAKIQQPRAAQALRSP